MYAKRDDTPDLRPYRERLLGVRSALSGLDYPHTWAVQRVYESERAAFLVRQYLHANLAQRITTRPFLTLIEKVGSKPANSGLTGTKWQGGSQAANVMPTDALSYEH